MSRASDPTPAQRLKLIRAQEHALLTEARFFDARSKLAQLVVETIDSGASVRTVAESFNVSPSYVHRLVELARRSAV